MGDIIMKVAMCVITILVAFVLVFAGFSIYDSYTAETFSLRKDSWNCTQSHKETYLQVVGKVMVPVTRTVCDNYVRIE